MGKPEGKCYEKEIQFQQYQRQAESVSRASSRKMGGGQKTSARQTNSGAYTKTGHLTETLAYVPSLVRTTRIWGNAGGRKCAMRGFSKNRGSAGAICVSGSEGKGRLRVVWE